MLGKNFCWIPNTMVLQSLSPFKVLYGRMLIRWWLKGLISWLSYGLIYIKHKTEHGRDTTHNWVNAEKGAPPNWLVSSRYTALSVKVSGQEDEMEADSHVLWALPNSRANCKGGLSITIYKHFHPCHISCLSFLRLFRSCSPTLAVFLSLLGTCMSCFRAVFQCCLCFECEGRTNNMKDKERVSCEFGTD